MQTIHQQVIHEIQQIPEANLVSLYDTIHYFRLGLIKNTDVHVCQKIEAGYIESGKNRKIRVTTYPTPALPLTGEGVRKS